MPPKQKKVKKDAKEHGKDKSKLAKMLQNALPNQNNEPSETQKAIHESTKSLLKQGASVAYKKGTLTTIDFYVAFFVFVVIFLYNWVESRELLHGIIDASDIPKSTSNKQRFPITAWTMGIQIFMVCLKTILISIVCAIVVFITKIIADPILQITPNDNRFKEWVKQGLGDEEDTNNLIPSGLRERDKSAQKAYITLVRDHIKPIYTKDSSIDEEYATDLTGKMISYLTYMPFKVHAILISTFICMIYTWVQCTLILPRVRISNKRMVKVHTDILIVANTIIFLTFMYIFTRNDS